ncbi:MAG: PmoA family protein [Verrucomicrobiae bacterium]|nr:PmoA family protein [Verrucomicrobiae bacterium]
MHRLAILSLALFPFLASAGDGEWTVTVSAGDHDRVATPLSVELPEEFVVGTGTIYLVPLDDPDAAPIPTQGLEGDSHWLVWVLDRRLPADTSRAYRILRRKEEATAQPAMRCSESESAITVTSGERSVLRYVKTPTEEAAKNDPVYTRTGYIHPLMTPSGKTVTGDYAPDHPHQHAIFNAWTKTTFEGRPINFWDQQKGHARISYTGTGETISGPVFAQFSVTHRHEDLTAPDHPRPVLEETWLTRVYRTEGNYYLFDIRTAQRCATESPLVIEQYHYGGMAIRGTSAWFDPDKNAEPPATFLTASGLGRIEGNHSRENWVALSGLLDGGTAGVAMFSHPANFRAPQWVRLHPTKPYFVFTPQVEEGFTIAPDKSYTGQYRYVAYDGETDPEFLESIWNDYAHPPKTRIDH